MLLLVNRRYPALGPVFGAIMGIALIVLGVATSQTMLVVWGVPSVVLAGVRETHQRRVRGARR
jgi:hypothetical protein